MRRKLCLVGVLILGLPLLSFAQQHDQHQHDGAAPDDVGVRSVRFETSCAPAVRDDFNRAVALLHSFWFPEATKAFNEVLAKDASCGMAYWGVALSAWGNPFGGLRTPQAIEAGRTAILKGQQTGSPTPRERALIDAVVSLFGDGQPGTQRARVLAYEQAMVRLAEQHPTDIEVRIFSALAINQTALPTDKTYAQQLKTAEILEPLFKKMPRHPGLAHYIIHAYDAPALAARALNAARRYASLAPAVPHALHMPSHTFTRLGYWTESVETNIKSADTAAKSANPGDQLHALDYQAYAYLQMAADRSAQAVLDRALAVAGGPGGEAAGAAGAGAFALAAIPARLAVERQAWAEAAALTLRPANTPYTEAITHFARAVGLARSGKPAEAAPDLAKLGELRDRLTKMQDAYWSEQVDIQRRVASAWTQFASGRKDEGIAELSAAADSEDATDKAAVTPGPVAPAREQLGFMLLEAGRPREALTAFEAVTKKEPNRFLALYGAGRAAEAANARSKARSYYRQLVAMCKASDSSRPELEHARGFIK